MKKICFMYMWPTFNESDPIIKNIFTNCHLLIYNSNGSVCYFNNQEFIDYKYADIIIFGVFLNNHICLSDIIGLKHINTLSAQPDKGLSSNSFQVKKILYITEPIKYIFTDSYKLYNRGIFDTVIGCVSADIGYKYPLYLSKFDYTDKSVYMALNTYVRNIDYLPLNFCCLINSHDNFNTRTAIYNKLKTIGHIDCPGKLYNNMSNNELDKNGNISFISNYIFNICSENTINNLSGYITEKIINCVLAGSIPIYCGCFDESDKLIFNTNRILFYELNETSINQCYEKVKELYCNKNKLKLFYKQPIFTPQAYDTIINMDSLLKSIF